MPPFPPLKNDRILKAAWGEVPDKLPVWVMRQAGRYLPEFMDMRKDHGFFQICLTPSLAAETTMLPIRRFDLDAAIIFSDILVIPHALGMAIEVKTGIGPVLDDPVTIHNINELNREGVIDRLKYVGEAIALTRHQLDGKVPIFGFSGAPWTLMGYMIEGKGTKTLSEAKKWLYLYPEVAHSLLDMLTDIIIDYLVMQVEAGAQILQIFDSSAELLNKELYMKWGIPYLKRIRQSVVAKFEEKKLQPVPMVLFAKGAHFCLPEQADLGFEVIGVDWTVEPRVAKNLLAGKNVTIQGNLDPCALYAPKDDLVNYIKKMISEFGTHRYIVNLGHGIYPDTPIEAVQTLVETVHSYKI